MATEIETDSSIIEASRIVISKGCRPARIVLRAVGGAQPFVTHLQVFDLIVQNGDPFFAHVGYHDGHYFRDRPTALVDFSTRAVKL